MAKPPNYAVGEWGPPKLKNELNLLQKKKNTLASIKKAF